MRNESRARLSYWLSVELLADDLLVVSRLTDWLPGWGVAEVVPGHKDLGWIFVTRFLKLSDFVLGEEFESENWEKITDVDFPEATAKGDEIFVTAFDLFGENIVDGEVGSDEDTETTDLWRLVFLVDGITGFVADGFKELNTEFFERGVVHILHQDVRVFFFIEAIEEFGVEVFVEVFWIDDLKESGFTSTWVTAEPDVWIGVGSEEVATLMNHRLEFFTVGEVVPWELGEGFLFVAFLDEGFHLDDDVVKLALFFLITTFGNLG